MNIPRRPAVWLLVIHLVIVFSVAGTFLFERHVYPRLWVRVAQYDPETPLRGRYLALKPLVDVCSFPREPLYYSKGYAGGPGSYRWSVFLDAKDGKLTPRLLGTWTWRSPAEISVTLNEREDCHFASVSLELSYFIPEKAASPFPLKPGQVLWAEATVPKKGPPRPIQLAISENGRFSLLPLR